MTDGKRLILTVCMTLSCSGILAAEPTPEMLIRQKHFKRAQAALQRQISSNPKDAAALVLLATVRIEFGDSDGAIKLASQAIALQPQNAAAHAILADGYGQKAGGDVGMFEKLRLARAFKKEAEQALALDPKNVDALTGMVEFHLQAPGVLGGDKAKAGEFADRIMAVDSDQGYQAKEEIAQHEKQTDQYAALVLKNVASNEHSYAALARISGFYLASKTKSLEKAADYALKALQLDRGRAEAYDVLAQVYAQQERWNDLDQLMQKAEKAVPDDLNPYYQAGRALLETGKDNARAERYFRKYLTQETEANAPKLGHAHWRLGLILEKEGNKPEAIKEIETAVQMLPSFEPARKDLKRIKS